MNKSTNLTQTTFLLCRATHIKLALQQSRIRIQNKWIPIKLHNTNFALPGFWKLAAAAAFTLATRKYILDKDWDGQQRTLLPTYRYWATEITDDVH
jgi:hypothetical protein